MGKDRRGIRDGTGPHKDSFQRSQGNTEGKRQQSGEPCPEKRE